MTKIKAIDTTSIRNKEWRTSRPSSGAKVMPSDAEQKPKALTQKYADGYDVWRWPEFQAFTKRLMIDEGAPITSLTICVPCDGNVTITQEFIGLDSETKQ